MLGGLSSYIPLVSKVSTIGARLAAVGLTAFGLKKLWSQEAKEKLSLIQRMAFSGSYLLHIAATSAAMAAFFDTIPLSPAVATAMMCTTSLLINFSNLIESSISQALLKKTAANLKKQLHLNNLDYQQSLALLEGMNEIDNQICLMVDEQQTLRSIKQRLNQATALPSQEKSQELINIFLEIEDQYQARSQQNNIIGTYFRSLPHDLNIENTLANLHEQIQQAQDSLQQIQSALQKFEQEKTKERLQRRLCEQEQNIKRLGILSVQCIRYKKIEDSIKQLQTLLIHKKQPSEQKILRERIDYFKSLLRKFSVIDQEDQLRDLEIGVTATLKDQVCDDPDGFSSKLRVNIEKQCDLLETKIKEQKSVAASMQACLALFKKNSQHNFKVHYDNIRKLSSTLAEVNKKLSVENLNKQNNQAKINFCSVTSVLAFMLCAVSQEGAAAFIKPLMMGIGGLGSAASLWGFYQRNLLIKKKETHATTQLKKVTKEIEFKKAAFAHRIPAQKEIKERTNRAAKTKALAALSLRPATRKEKVSKNLTTQPLYQLHRQAPAKTSSARAPNKIKGVKYAKR